MILSFDTNIVLKSIAPVRTLESKVDKDKTEMFHQAAIWNPNMSTLKENTPAGIRTNGDQELTNPNNGNIYNIKRLILGASYTTYRVSDGLRCHLKILDYDDASEAKKDNKAIANIRYF